MNSMQIDARLWDSRLPAKRNAWLVCVWCKGVAVKCTLKLKWESIWDCWLTRTANFNRTWKWRWFPNPFTVIYFPGTKWKCPVRYPEPWRGPLLGPWIALFLLFLLLLLILISLVLLHHSYSFSLIFTWGCTFPSPSKGCSSCRERGSADPSSRSPRCTLSC